MSNACGCISTASSSRPRRTRVRSPRSERDLPPGILLALLRGTMQNVGGSAAAGAEVGVTRVLVVGASAAAAAWPSTVGPRLEVVHAPDIDTAAAQLHERPVDVVVVDGDPAPAGPAELSRLRAVLGRASLLVLSSDCPGDD